MKRRILLLWDRLDIVGGVETVLLNICKYINKDKFEVVIGTFKDGKVRKQFEDLGIEVYSFERKSKYNISQFLKLKKFITNKKVDIIHTHGHLRYT